MNKDSLSHPGSSPEHNDGGQSQFNSSKELVAFHAEHPQQPNGPRAPETSGANRNTVATDTMNAFNVKVEISNNEEGSGDYKDEKEVEEEDEDEEEEEDEDEDEDEEEDENEDEEEDEDEDDDGIHDSDFEEDESDEEQDASPTYYTTINNSNTTARPAYLCQPEKSKAWDVLNGDHPCSGVLLKQVPVEIWHMALSFVPPTRLAHLTRVSKGWRTMIDSLHFWQELAIRNDMGQPGGSVATYKDLVLGQMVAVCDVCLNRSKDYGIHLPLPVQRPDLLGLVWMCKRCRDNYGATHPEVMSSRAAQEDDVFVQGPQRAQIQRRLQPVYRCSRYSDFGYRYRDDFSDFDSEYDEDDDYSDDYEYDYQMRTEKVWTQWTNKKDQLSWLNQHLSDGRQRMMQTLLAIHRLQIRADSRLCSDFIGGCAQYNPYAIADVMAEMAWFFDHTRYKDFCRQSPEAGKTKAVAHWAKDLIGDARVEEFERQQSFESLQDGSAPPKSLWPKVFYALEAIRRVEDERVKKTEERRVDLEARVKAREERKRRAKDTESEDANNHGGEGSRPAGEPTAETVGDEDEIEDGREDEDNGSVDYDETGSEDLDLDLESDSNTRYWGSDYSLGYTQVQSALSSKFSFQVDVDIKDH
ncbi:hypothetical protein BGZ68_002738 [Mortierella alpina]|nr:hypothetical protein BGZ68_002738 [Mortierella alpina]